MNLWSTDKDLWSKDRNLRSRTRTKTCKLVLEDKASRTRTFLEDNDTGIKQQMSDRGKRMKNVFLFCVCRGRSRVAVYFAVKLSQNTIILLNGKVLELFLSNYCHRPKLVCRCQ